MSPGQSCTFNVEVTNFILQCSPNTLTHLQCAKEAPKHQIMKTDHGKTVCTQASLSRDISVIQGSWNTSITRKGRLLDSNLFSFCFSIVRTNLFLNLILKFSIFTTERICCLHLKEFGSKKRSNSILSQC